MSDIAHAGLLHFHADCRAGIDAGPRLIVLGAVHGNETCGTQGIRRAINDIENGQLHIRRGSVTFVPITNPLAYARKQREGHRNLNRNFCPTAEPADFEDRIVNWLAPLLAQHDVLLDLHSFHTAGQPFVMLGPEDNSGALEPFAHSAKERALAQHLGVRRFVDGWLDTYADGVANRVRQAEASKSRTDSLNTDARYGVGTTEYMRSVGGYGVTLECGQHEDAQSPAVAYRAIRNALAFLNICDEPAPQAVSDTESLRLYKVVDKKQAEDGFARAWASFDRLEAGQLIGTFADGTPVIAEKDGYIVFPNPKAAAGQEWFYLAEARPLF
ncbi:M14 family metallopeptidase [soil metagenome]